MMNLFTRRVGVTTGLESIVSDLEIRQQVLIGDSTAIKVMEGETKEERKDMLDQHITNASAAHNLINDQFRLIEKLSKNQK